MIMNGQLNQRPDLVIFDMDGLILDSERLFMEQERIVCLQYGYDMTPENYITTIGTAGETLRKILRDLYGEDYPMEKISRESRERVNRIIEAQGPPVKPGIGDLMEALYRNKIPFCILRSISDDNSGGEGSHVEYAVFAKSAADKAVEIITAYINACPED